MNDLQQVTVTSTSIPGSHFVAVTPNETPNRVEVNFNPTNDEQNGDVTSSNASAGGTGTSSSVESWSDPSTSSPPVVTFTIEGASWENPESSTEETASGEGTSSNSAPVVSFPPQSTAGGFGTPPQQVPENSDGSTRTPPVVIFVPDFGNDSSTMNPDSPPETGNGNSSWSNGMESSPPLVESPPPSQPDGMVMTTNIPGASFSEGTSDGEPSQSPDINVELPNDEDAPADSSVTIDGNDVESNAGSEATVTSGPVDENLIYNNDTATDSSVHTNVTLVDESNPSSTNSSDVAAAVEEEANKDKTNEQRNTSRNEDAEDMEESSTRLSVISVFSGAVAIAAALTFV